MVQFNLHRRDFLKKSLGVGAALSAAPIVGALAGCSALPSSKQSYIHNKINPENISVVHLWTDIMLQAIRNLSITPPPATRAFAMAHLAGFLALNGIEKRYNVPFDVKDGPEDVNGEVAYITAFSMALSEALETSFAVDRNRFLEKYPDNDLKLRAVDYGRYAARYVIKMRIRDGAESNKSEFYLGRYPRRKDNLRWAPTGPFFDADYGPRFGTFARGHLPGWGAQKSWVMRHKKQFLAPHFIDPRSPEFAEQYFQVKQFGEAESKIRTEDQTQIAFFWEDGPRGVTPPGHWQVISMEILQSRGYSLVDQAAYFAMLSMAQADAGITTWDSKYVHDIVRPETVIRQRADEMGNVQMTGHGQSDWRTLIPTPSFPAYTSGHSTFSAVSARMLANFIGTDAVSFSSESPDLVNWPKQLTGVKRSWNSIWAAAEEGGMSRIYGGIHWDVDNIEGLRIGKELADYVFKNSFVRKV